LNTVPSVILLVRHASAGDRYRWWGDDVDRPLDERGRAQADALADAYGDAPLTALLTSRAVRCQQTVGPLAQRAGADLSVHKALFEGDPASATELVRELARADEAGFSVLCSHADVIPEVLRDLMFDGMRVHGPRGCAMASAWELTIADGHVTRGRYLPRPGGNR
jgi:8-oxo-dGTP diphosphatase